MRDVRELSSHSQTSVWVLSFCLGWLEPPASMLKVGGLEQWWEIMQYVLYFTRAQGCILGGYKGIDAKFSVCGAFFFLLSWSRKYDTTLSEWFSFFGLILLFFRPLRTTWSTDAGGKWSVILLVFVPRHTQWWNMYSTNAQLNAVALRIVSKRYRKVIIFALNYKLPLQTWTLLRSLFRCLNQSPQTRQVTSDSNTRKTHQ